MNRTRHYDFPLFESSDKPSWLVDWNTTMSLLDTKLYEAAVGNAGASVAGDIERLQNQVIDIYNHLSTLSESDSNILHIIAPAFDKDTNYLKRDLVINYALDDTSHTTPLLYECKDGYTSGSGWNYSEWTQKDLSDVIQSRYSELNTLINSIIGGDLSQLTSDVSTLKGQMSTAQSDVSTLQTNLGIVQSDISSLDTRVTTLESAGDVLPNPVLVSVDKASSYITNNASKTITFEIKGSGVAPSYTLTNDRLGVSDILSRVTFENNLAYIGSNTVYIDRIVETYNTDGGKNINENKDFAVLLYDYSGSFSLSIPSNSTVPFYYKSYDWRTSGKVLDFYFRYSGAKDYSVYGDDCEKTYYQNNNISIRPPKLCYLVKKSDTIKMSGNYLGVLKFFGTAPGLSVVDNNLTIKGVIMSIEDLPNLYYN